MEKTIVTCNQVIKKKLKCKSNITGTFENLVSDAFNNHITVKFIFNQLHF